jgi:hypothetical protein
VTSSIPRQIVRARPHDPPTDRRLAAIHLRMGQLGLARAELEALAGAGELDDRTLLVLAEARWRTGDLTGAGEAAQAYIATGGDDVVAFVIAAEATAAVGRPSEARRLAGRVLERADRPLDQIFAGQRRSLIWPVDTSEAATPDVIFPQAAHEAQTEVITTRPVSESAPESAVLEQLAAPVEAVSSPEATEAVPATRPEGFWDLETIRNDEVPESGDALVAARADLAAGDVPAAALHLGLAIRIGPDLAGEVLEIIEAQQDRTPELDLIRGDALRLLGREDDAWRAYADVSLAIVSRQSSRADDDRAVEHVEQGS